MTKKKELTEKEKLKVRDFVRSLIFMDWDLMKDDILDALEEECGKSKWTEKRILAQEYLNKVANNKFEDELDKLIDKYFNEEV